MISPLHLGTARVEITPRHPVPLAGFSFRSGAFEGVHSPLYLRAFLFSQEDREALLVSADLFCWPKAFLRADNAILHATHNHSGPQTSCHFAPALGCADHNCLESLNAALISAAQSARANQEPITIERGTGRCGFAVHRRKRIDGMIRMAPEPSGPVDHELNLIRFRTPSGASKAVLVHYSCHPTASAANEVCGEFPGLAMAKLENELGCAAGYLQGCCADVRPAMIRDGEFYRGTPNDCIALANELAEETAAVLDTGMRAIAPGMLTLERKHTALPTAPPPTKDELHRIESDEGIFGEWSRLLLSQPGRVTQPLLLESTLLQLSPEFGLLTFNAEMSVEYGLAVKRESQGHLLPLGYTNGAIGYVSTAQQIDEGGYEPAEAYRYYGKAAPFTRGVEEAVRQHIRQFQNSQRKEPLRSGKKS